MAQRIEASKVCGKFVFTVEGLCVTRDMFDLQLGPMDRSTDQGTDRISIWLSGAIFDSERLPDGTDLVEVDEFAVQVDRVQSPPLTFHRQNADADPSRLGPAVAELHDSLSQTASDIARDFLTCMVLDLRQRWVAPTGTPSPQKSLVYDAESKEVLAQQELSPGRPIPFRMLTTVPRRGIVLSPADLPRLNNTLAGNKVRTIGLPERLLSSAFNKLYSAYEDPQTAVFLSAVACETKIKTVLRSSTASAQGPLLELILDNPRDVTISALQHFDHLCKIVIGQSLKEDSTSRHLWKGLDELFQARNRVAHRGFEPSREEAESHISTAEKVFDWLDKLLASR